MPRGYRKYDFKGSCKSDKGKKSWESRWDKKKDFDKKCWKVVERDDKGRDDCGRDKDKKKKFDCVEEEVCTEYTIDFNFRENGEMQTDAFLAGEIVSQVSFGGLVVTIEGQENPDFDDNNPDNDAMIFDSRVETGQDPDLVTATEEDPEGQGNFLILTEDDIASDPDDAEFGGEFVFRFSQAVDLKSIYIRDSEGTTIEAGGETIIVPSLEDAMEDVIDLDIMDNVTEMTITLEGSGAIDDLVFELCETEKVCVRDCDYGI